MELNVQMLRANCYAYTFDDQKIMSLVRSLVKHGEVLNLFAGKNIVVGDETRVDLNKSLPRLDYVMDSFDFVQHAIMNRNLRYDTIIYDPPWNERKSKELYNGYYIGKFTKLKDDIVKLLKHGGVIISAGYEIDNFSQKRGMQLQHITVVNPSGEIRPFFITVEKRLPSLEEFDD
jgi:predicted RNA methylase